MLFRGLLATQLSGSLDGLIAAHNHGGPYFRNRTTPTDPNTSRQILMRAALTAAYANWLDLDPTLRAAWEAFARSTERTNRIGAQRHNSGWNEFVRAFTYRHYAEAELSIGLTTTLSTAPAGPIIFGMAPGVVLDAGTDQFIMSVPEQSGTWWEDEESAWLLELSTVRTAPGVVAYTPYPPTRNFFKGPWQLAGSVLGQASGNITVTLTRNATTGERVFWRARVTSKTRGLSTVLYGVAIAS